MTTEQTLRFSAVKALDKFAEHRSGYGRRPTLQKINIQDGHAVATDGFRLMATPTNTNRFHGSIEPAEVLTLAKATKKPTMIHLGDVEADSNHQFSTHAVITDDRNAPQIAKRIAVHDDTYPDWRQIMPADEPTVSVRLNARYLKDLADAALAMGSLNDSVVLHLYAPDKPVKFSFKDETDTESFGLIMPMLMGDK